MDINFPLILDAATGTRLFKAGMPGDVCPEQWVLSNPDVPFNIQNEYVELGSEVIYAPTFGANSAMLESHGIFGEVEQYNRRLVQISKDAAKGRALVAGDISSTGTMIYPLGDKSFEDLYEIYYEQVSALENAGADLYIIETMSSVAEARAAVLAVRALGKKPVLVTFTCDASGRTSMGTDVCAALQIMQGMEVDAFGLNCSVGPADMLVQIRRLSEYAAIPLIAKPNAGLPKSEYGKSAYSVGAEEFSSYIPALAAAGVNIFGACCGSDESFIPAIKKALDGVEMKAPYPAHPEMLPCATEKDAFSLDAAVVCSRIFNCDDDLADNISELDSGELFGIEIRSEEDIREFSAVQYAIKNPLCIICDDAVLLEKALRAYQGRPLYEGKLTEEELLPLVRKYGLII